MSSSSKRDPARTVQPRTQSNTLSRSSALLLGGGVVALIAIFTILLFVVPGLFKPVAPPASAEGKISFVRTASQNGTRILYVVNPDGTNQQQLTQDVLIEGVTTWSPDGRYIAAQATINGLSGVIRIAVGPDNKASEIVQLTSDAKADSALPAWSPDSKQIAFQSKREGGDFQVFVMNVDGSNKRRFSDGTGLAGQASWSPDGKSVVYVQGANKDSGKDIYVVPAAGGAPRAITKMNLNLAQPMWTPDGNTVVFLQKLGDRAAVIMSVPADGSVQPRTLAEAGAIQYVRVSPTGGTLAYSRVLTENPNGGSDIYTVPASGGTATAITTQTQEDYMPSWSPDGKRLTWAGIPGQSGDHKIIVASADGTNTHVVSAGDGDDFMPMWASAVK